MLVTNTCCGCTACEKICPRSAISMVQNKKGFLEPKISENQCVNCGLCVQVCPMTHPTPSTMQREQEFFAAKRIHDQQRMSSQSGGAFACLAEEILSRKGTVYGVTLDRKLNAIYSRVTNAHQLEKLKGSKYVQASIEQTYTQVKADLKAEKWVLFSGTPCHVHGLVCYLQQAKVDTTKLVTVDLICHGVPSPQLYRDYLQMLSTQHNGAPIKKFNFRSKIFGWHSHITMYTTRGKNYVSEDYVKLFYSHLCLRDSCYSCPFASLDRPGDLTIGDCWGLEKFAKEFSDNKGCSLVITNNQKGADLWQSVQHLFSVITCKNEHVLQHNLQNPTMPGEKMSDFWADYHQYGLEYVLMRYCNGNPTQTYEYIFPHQYIRRAVSKAKRVLNRIFVMR